MQEGVDGRLVRVWIREDVQDEEAWGKEHGVWCTGVQDEGYVIRLLRACSWQRVWQIMDKKGRAK